MTGKQTTYLYWGCTIVFCAMMGMSGYCSLVVAKGLPEVMAHLGYPIYFAQMLGTFKLLGIAVLLLNRPKRLKEWAYAGFAFDLVFAAGSHIAVGDPPLNWIAPAVFMAILLGSYFTWHKLNKGVFK